MAVTIFEALCNADHNLGQACASPLGVNTILLALAKEQLHNAVGLLLKGYGLNDVMEELLESHDSVDDVPGKADSEGGRR